VGQVQQVLAELIEADADRVGVGAGGSRPWADPTQTDDPSDDWSDDWSDDDRADGTTRALGRYRA
jgi:hypothetical protein